MPYIFKEDRGKFNRKITELNEFINTPGELNYVITRLVWLYLKTRGIRYSNLNEAIGVLECVKQELYRRVAGPHEDGKCDENGDVYE